MDGSADVCCCSVVVVCGNSIKILKKPSNSFCCRLLFPHRGTNLSPQTFKTKYGPLRESIMAKGKIKTVAIKLLSKFPCYFLLILQLQMILLTYLHWMIPCDLYYFFWWRPSDRSSSICNHGTTLIMCCTFSICVGTAGTGFFYVTTKNPRNVTRKLALRKVLYFYLHTYFVSFCDDIFCLIYHF